MWTISERCVRLWERRVKGSKDLPVTCPSCNSPYWNSRPKKEKTLLPLTFHGEEILILKERFNFDHTKMVETFLEIQDIAAEKRDVMRLKEGERDSRHSFRGIGSGRSFDRFTEAAAKLVTLNQQGVSLDQIISLPRTINQTRRQHWERSASQGWSNDYINEKTHIECHFCFVTIN